MLKKSKFRGISMGNGIEVLLSLKADDFILLGDTE